MPARFTWERVDVRGDDECWPWLGQVSRVGGHGKCVDGDGNDTSAHRVAYMERVGSIPSGKVLLHSCDNPSCCNPSHLFPGSQRENVLDMHRKGRTPKRLSSAPKHLGIPKCWGQ